MFYEEENDIFYYSDEHNKSIFLKEDYSKL